VFEILELASKQRSNAKKVEVLKTYEHDSLKAILIWNFDSTVISLLPEGEVPYGDVKDQNVYSGTSQIIFQRSCWWRICNRSRSSRKGTYISS
jgi:hypothetical protein